MGKNPQPVMFMPWDNANSPSPIFFSEGLDLLEGNHFFRQYQKRHNNNGSSTSSS